MSEPKFTKGTEEKHKVQLDSHPMSAVWSSGGAFSGRKAGFDVRTAFVGSGAPILVVGRSELANRLSSWLRALRCYYACTLSNIRK